MLGNQYVFGQTLVANAVSITTATPTNILAAGIVCNAGAWVIIPTVNFIPAASTSLTVMNICASTTSATLTTVDTGLWKQTIVALVPTAAQVWVGNPWIFNFTAPTTVYLVAQATFTVSTLTASGSLAAIQLSP